MKKLLPIVFLLCAGCGSEPAPTQADPVPATSGFEGMIEGRLPDHEIASEMILSTVRRTANDETRLAVTALLTGAAGLDGSLQERAAYDTWAATLLYDRFDLAAEPRFPAAPTLAVQNDMSGLYRATTSGGLIHRRESVIYSILHNLNVRHSAEARRRHLSVIGDEPDFNEYLAQNAEAAEALVNEMESRNYQDGYLRILGGIARASVRIHSLPSEESVSSLQTSLDEIYRRSVSMSREQQIPFLESLKGQLFLAGMDRPSMLGPAGDATRPDDWLRDQTLQPSEDPAATVVGTGRSYGKNHEAFLILLEEDLRTMPSRKSP